MTKHWYVIAAEPNMDVRFARDVGERGYETLVAWTFTREKAGNRAWVEARLRLSPYVWVAIDFDAGQNFATVEQTFGFSSAISLYPDENGDRNLSEVPERIIQGLRLDQIEDFETAVRRVRRKESLYHVGEIVAVGPDHPFHGFQGPISDVRRGSVIAELGPNRMPVRLNETDILPIRPFEKQANARG
jgi:hypothetical protein